MRYVAECRVRARRQPSNPSIPGETTSASVFNTNLDFLSNRYVYIIVYSHFTLFKIL